jgi:hypothetical protein
MGGLQFYSAGEESSRSTGFRVDLNRVGKKGGEMGGHEVNMTSRSSRIRDSSPDNQNMSWECCHYA